MPKLGFVILTLLILLALTNAYRRGRVRQSTRMQGEHETQCRGQRTRSYTLKYTTDRCKDSVSSLEANSPKERMNIIMTYRLCIWEEQGIYKNGLIYTHALGLHLKSLFPGRVGKELSSSVMSNCFNPAEENETLVVDADNLEILTPFMRCIQKTWKMVCDYE